MTVGALTTTKVVESMIDSFEETYNEQDLLLPLVDFHEPSGAAMQNAGNTIWQPVQQHRPRQSGWDMTGNELGIIEEEYPAVLGVPENDVISQRADDARDMRYWERAATQSAMQQATGLNSDLATAMYQQGSLFVRSNATSGFDFVAEAKKTMNKRQGYNTGRCFLFNDEEEFTFSKDLAARQTLQGRPESTWTNGQIGQNVAGFNLYTGSFLPNIIGGAGQTTVTGNQSFAPQAGAVNATTKAVTNIDYRTATIPVADSSVVIVGSKVTFSNGGTSVKAVGLADKTITTDAMTFTIIDIVDATHVTIFPKPIAADDAALDILEKSYANINTTILNNATMDRVNIDASKQVNLFWDKSAVEVIGGTIPGDMFQSLGGNKSQIRTMKNGLKMYMLWDGDILATTFTYRLFTWYGITICDPSRVGVSVHY